MKKKTANAVVWMPFIGPWEIALILVIVLILFGGRKLPQLAKAIGETIREYRKASSEPIAEEPPKPKTESEEQILKETARKLGIDVQGKTAEQLSEEIVKRSSGQEKGK